jgi:hypothetical protein
LSKQSLQAAEHFRDRNLRPAVVEKDHDTFLRLDFQGSRVTSDSGWLLVRELDERLSLKGLIQDNLVESRTDREQSVLPADGLGEGLGTRRGADFQAALLRVRLVGPRGELGQFGALNRELVNGVERVVS